MKKNELDAEECNHTMTQGREGETGSWCTGCGIKVYDVEKGTCSQCANFTPDTKCDGRIGYCDHFKSIECANMHVYYKISEGTCFKQKAETAEDAAKRLFW